MRKAELLVFRCKVKDSGRQDTHTETEREGGEKRRLGESSDVIVAWYRAGVQERNQRGLDHK